MPYIPFYTHLYHHHTNKFATFPSIVSIVSTLNFPPNERTQKKRYYNEKRYSPESIVAIDNQLVLYIFFMVRFYIINLFSWHRFFFSCFIYSRIIFCFFGQTKLFRKLLFFTSSSVWCGGLMMQINKKKNNKKKNDFVWVQWFVLTTTHSADYFFLVNNLNWIFKLLMLLTT